MTSRADHLADFAEFLTASPSSFHAAAETARRLAAAGYESVDETAAWPAEPGRYFVLRDGAVIAWHVPAGATAVTPFRILGAHTDSPGFKLKPRPTVESKGWLQAGVEVYGGPLLNSWLDRELELAGRIVTRDGAEVLVRTGPFLRIPQLAIHLDREANDGLKLDRQKHTVPVYGLGDADGNDLLEILAAKAGLDGAADIVGYDLITADTQPPARFGLDDALFAAGRMDDLSSVHAGLVALLAASSGDADSDSNAEPGHISMLAAFDHEELGSASRSGASGPFLEDVLTRIGAALGAGVDERARAMARSWCLSADSGHSVHPNYPEKHDPVNQPVAGKGPLLKINASQRYATDARGAALWAGVCARAGVEFQEFVSNNTVPCGSTIGPLTATRLGISTVDVGVPLLSMHSARELAHVDDLVALTRAIEAFFAAAD